MIAELRRFLHRNRRRVFIGSSLLAIIYFGVGYLRQKFIDYQLKLAEEKFSREQIKRRFEQTQKDSLYTIYSLVPVLSAPILDALQVEKITQLLQARRLEKKNIGGHDKNFNDDISTVSATTNNDITPFAEGERKSKNELWNDLKSQSLTRLITLIYSNALLILLTRLQLNILARREYLEDAIKVASTKSGFNVKKIESNDPNKQSSNYVNEQAYLSCSWWLLNRGWTVINERVERAVNQTFKDITPRAELTLDEFAILLNSTQKLIEDDSSFVIKSLLPPKNLETFLLQQTLDEVSLSLLHENSENFQILLNETTNYITSSSSSIVLSSLVNAGISTTLNHVAWNLTQKETSNMIQPNLIKVKLAVLLAQISRAANDFKSATSNEYINNMDKTAELDELSASVYSNFEV
ncbi:hypothetical protein WICMUC_001905 [Wickerhamomyces mucosus]|uniref:Peroxin-3 n=1 Tax=Wickerhamomyces mucosus TaxID=1378264 RepID=A0A9P8TFX9_9ASCO|nr:hypothetical protein WICMUC_001905 [Wickerhamomyces mucosus]